MTALDDHSLPTRSRRTSSPTRIMVSPSKKKYEELPAVRPAVYREKPSTFKRAIRKLKLYLGQTERIEIHNPAAKEAVRALCLTQRQLRRLKMKFETIDIDNSGTMDAAEFFQILDEARTPLTDELLSLIDLDGNGTVEFDEFVNVLMTYCMYSKEDILRFCFDCFDKDHSNAVDESEFTLLLSAVNNGKPLFPGNFRTALEQFDSNADGLIDFEEFKAIDKRYPLIFFPAFRLQDMMQRHTLGESTWKRIHERVNRQRRLDEYRRTHGKDPPVSLADKAWRALSCSFGAQDEIDIFAIDKRKPSIAEPSTPGRRKSHSSLR
ncbi:hypothetical protein CTAYLR_002436 [Chrysophaeum taylorii]|uniref:EF-hand domain-containing protein n=1 Tax=Chrysophaeum taylorii TaxID=2483200 RepID=A0AAD7UM54_9STRA|nr:hypothetical protein CTAYLR_002436 [Chrysophaeum taylorii]